MDVSHLELALRYAKTASDPVALTVLKDAVERFLGAQKKAYPATPKSVPESGNKMSPEESRRILDMIKNIQNHPKGCPACGAPNGVPHFCPGPRHNTGIEYWMNQPRAMTNSNPQYVLLGSGDDLNSRGMGNGKGFGSSGINLSAAKGRSC